MFKIKRATLEEQYKKYYNGIKSLGGPNILSIKEQTQLHDLLGQKIQSNVFPSYFRIYDYLMNYFHRDFSPNSLLKFISMHFTDFKFVFAKQIEEVNFDDDANANEIDNIIIF